MFGSTFLYTLKQENCAKLSAKASCEANSDCYWTPLYGIKFEKSKCAEAANLIETITDLDHA